MSKTGGRAANDQGGGCALVKSAATPREDAEQLLQALLAAIVRADEAALSEFVRLTERRVGDLANSIVRNRSCADEVVGDVYLQVWQHAANFDPARATAIGWLRMLTRARSLDHCRRVRRHALIELDEPHDVEAAFGEPDPWSIVERAQRLRLFSLAMADLGPLPRQLISMSLLRGLSHEEIATALRLPLGTVKSHIRRALSALRFGLERAVDRLPAKTQRARSRPPRFEGRRTGSHVAGRRTDGAARA